MARSFIFNMGYDTSHVISVLTKEGLKEGSKVVLIIPGETDERQENAVEELKNYLNGLSLDVSLEIFSAGESFQKDFLEISRLLSDLENVYVSLSGGSRDLLIPLTLAASFCSEEVVEIFFRSDIDSELRTLDIPHSSIDLSKSELAVLQSTDKKKSVADIASSTEFKESAVYSAVSSLEEKGLLHSEKENGRRNYEITGTGKVIKQTRH